MQGNRSIWPAKVAFIEARYHSFYGSQRQQVKLAAWLDRRFFEPLLVTTREGPVSQEARNRGVSVEILPLADIANAFGQAIPNYPLWKKALVALELLRMNFRAWSLFRKEQPVVVYAQDWRALLYVIFAARALRVPVLWFVAIDGKREFGAQLVLKLATRVLTIAEGVKSQFTDRNRALYQHKFRGLRTGLDFGERGSRALAQQALCGRYSIPEGSRIVALVGSISPRKGHDLLVRSMPRVLQSWPNAFLLFVGDSPPGYTDFLEKVRAKAMELGLADRIRVSGFVKDVGEIYQGLDLTVLPSRIEGLPTVLIEALSYGVPVVSTEVSGAREIVTDTLFGTVVPLEDVNALSAAMVDQLCPKRMTAELIEKRSAYARRMFSREAFLQEFSAVMDEILICRPDFDFPRTRLRI